MRGILMVLALFLIIVLSGCVSNADCNDRCLLLESQLREMGMASKYGGTIVGGECRDVSVYAELEKQGYGAPSGKCGLKLDEGEYMDKYCDCQLDNGKFMSENETFLTRATSNERN